MATAFRRPALREVFFFYLFLVLEKRFVRLYRWLRGSALI